MKDIEMSVFSSQKLQHIDTPEELRGLGADEAVDALRVRRLAPPHGHSLLLPTAVRWSHGAHLGPAGRRGHGLLLSFAAIEATSGFQLGVIRPRDAGV